MSHECAIKWAQIAQNLGFSALFAKKVQKKFNFLQFFAHPCGRSARPDKSGLSRGHIVFKMELDLDPMWARVYLP